MKNIAIVGAGPAGLYFAILIRERYPTAAIAVYERNAPDDIAGWGIVLHLGTIGLLKKCDQHSYDDIVSQSKRWGDVDIYHRHEQIRVKGKDYISVSRTLLLNALRKRCSALDIHIHYNCKITDVEALYHECDLLVGADGANSCVREHFTEQFKPSVDIRNNRYIWLGCERIFPTISHIFKSTDMGIFTAEAYLYSDTHSTFIATCDQETWARSGFESMALKDSIACLNDIFADELEGHALLANQSARWGQFPIVKNQHWVCPGVLLLGDALHTAHFSIGSGTRLALEDAIVATRALERCDNLDTALEQFAQSRRPLIEKYQQAALESLGWFEQIDAAIELDLIPFAFQVMTRSSQVDIRSLKLQDPAFVEQYLQWQQSITHT